MLIKLLVLVITLFVVICSGQPVDSKPKHVFSSETKLKVRGAITICLAETEADPHFLEIIKEGKYCLDEPFKKLIHCTYSKSGYTYSDGSIKICKIAAEYPYENEITKILKKCDLKVRNDPVETTFAFFRCFQDSSHEALPL